jgi:hypothetical protein
VLKSTTQSATASLRFCVLCYYSRLLVLPLSSVKVKLTLLFKTRNQVKQSFAHVSELYYISSSIEVVSSILRQVGKLANQVYMNTEY